jgi:hypothetical protein
MTLNINDIRAKLKAQQDKKENRTFGGDNAIYAFWNIPEGSNATLRFLPDNDPSNDFFWVERLVIRLPFAGIKGESEKETTVTVPCMDMWGETCPILAETRPWWKDEDLKPVARKYWKKKSYVFQGFVVNNPMDESNSPTNPIRRFVINPSIFDIVKASLMDPDMEDMPTDYVTGRDFKLTKTMKGGFANYVSSSWSIRSRALNDTELSAIREHGLFTLKEYLPKKPSQEELEVIKDMFHSSVNGDAFDQERFGKYYKPAGSFNSNAGGTSNIETASDTDDYVPAQQAETKVVVPSGANAALAGLRNRVQSESVVETPVATPAAQPTDKKLSTDELMEILRNRKAK